MLGQEEPELLSVGYPAAEGNTKSWKAHEQNTFPVVDLFAGPGGLGEGFATALDGDQRRRFRSIVSIERDPFSHETLLFRHFFRHFPDGEAPDEYYRFLAEQITKAELFDRHPAAYANAKLSALRISLGKESHAEVRRVIRNRLAGSDHWALVGGPPCQAYSLVGRARMKGDPEFEQNEKHTLYLEYLQIIADHRPPIFVMENVKGLLSATIDGKSTINRIVRDLQRPATAITNAPVDLAYRLYSLTDEEMAEGEVDPKLFLVHAEDHGVPQARHRMFIVGIRNDLKVRPKILRKMTAPTVRHTIGSLPPIRSGLSKEKDSRDAWLRAIRQISNMNVRQQLNGAMYAADVARELKFDKLVELRSPRFSSSDRYVMRRPNHPVLRTLYDERLPVLTSHEARSHMASDLRRYFYAATFAATTGLSPRLADFPAGLLPDHQNVEEGRAGKMFSDRFRVQLADHASSTVTSHISKDGHYFIHYDRAQCRSLTVREAARLQTFPDNYFFAGPRTAQYHQVGNAVPPQLASQIATIVAEVLDSIRNGAMMADTITSERRSWNMSRIRGRDTAPELRLRSLLHRAGFRFRLHAKPLPGRPDIVLPKYRTAIFVHGCFWHRHSGCRNATTPSTRAEFWQEKFDGNVRRDARNRADLEATGWTVMTVWECELKTDAEEVVRRLAGELRRGG